MTRLPRDDVKHTAATLIEVADFRKSATSASSQDFEYDTLVTTQIILRNEPIVAADGRFAA
jgi:hypothetical protein